MIPRDTLKTLAIQHGVSDTEFEVLSRAIEGEPTDAIAIELKIKPTAVRKRLGEVYKKFDIVGTGPGKLAKLQTLLMTYVQDHPIQDQQNQIQPPTDVKQSSRDISPMVQDWGKFSDVESFYGRKEELTQLERWILKDHCRLLVLWGIGGIGKTTLSLKLIERIGLQFDRVLWRSLSRAPLLQDLLADLIQELSTDPEARVPDVNLGIARVVDYLKQFRCLIVLDSVEALLRIDDLAGDYRQGYGDYGQLFEQVGKVAHHSCLVIASSEKPKEFVSLESKKVRAFQLQGLNDVEGQEIFKEKGFSLETDHEWQTIIERYGGNPLALKIVSVTIQELFEGNVAEFLKQGITVFGTIRSLLDQQFNRLSGLEQTIVYWLAINREPMSLQQLRDDMVPPPPQARLLDALESLGRRSLVEKHKASFSLQPVVLDYALDRLVEQICTEIATEEIALFNSHALLKAEATDYLRALQLRFILQPLIDKLFSVFELETVIEEQLLRILATLQQRTPLKPGYAAGNVLNLLWQLGADASDRDFSRLTVRQAYLQTMKLHRVNFTGADLTKSVFADLLGSILVVVFSPDGTLLATSDTNYQICLWNAQTGERLATWRHNDWIRALAFSPDGKTLVSGGEDCTIRFWDVSTGQCERILTGHCNWIRAIAFSPDGKILGSGSEDQTIWLWDVSTGHCLTCLKEHFKVVRSIAFSPDGKMLASGGGDQIIKLWEVATGQCQQTLRGHSRGIYSLAFSPNGQLLASGSSDSTIKLWTVETGNCLNTLTEHRGWVWAVMFNPNGETLASGSADQTVRIWNVANGHCLEKLQGHTSAIRSIAYRSDGQVLASGSEDQTVRLWDCKTWDPLRTFQGYARGVHSVAFSPDSQFLAIGSEDSRVWLWNTVTDLAAVALSRHTSRVRSVAFSPNGELLASGSDDQTIMVCNATTGEWLKTLHGHRDGVLSVAFSRDGTLLASGSSDRQIGIWEVATGRFLRFLEGHGDWVWSVAFGPIHSDSLFSHNAPILATGSRDLTVRLWNAHTGECLKILEGHTNWIRSVAFSPDGKTLVSSSVGRTVRLWDIATGKPLNTLDGYSNGIRSVAFSPDSQILASGSYDQAVRLWDITSGQCLHTLKGHTSLVRSVTFSQDGRILASGSNDETIKLWDVHTGQELKTLTIGKPYEGMNITKATGLSQTERTTLIALGAIDHGFSGAVVS